MNAKPFLDTNVIVYAFSSNDPRNETAEALLAGGISVIEVTLNTPGALEMLRAMRAALGDEQFLAFLQVYLEARSGAIATGDDFWSAYQATGGDPEVIKAAYFGPE